MTSTKAPTDEALMLAYANGDASSFETLLRRHQRPLFTFLLHNTRDSTVAEDLFQDIFMRLIRGRDRYRPTGSFRGWLFSIAHNVLTDSRRRAGVREDHAESFNMNDADHRESGKQAMNSELPSAEFAADPVEATVSKELGERIVSALERIPSEQREVFLLRERGGLEFSMIAEITGHPLATVKSRMRYALANLRQRLSENLQALPEYLHE